MLPLMPLTNQGVRNLSSYCQLELGVLALTLLLQMLLFFMIATGKILEIHVFLTLERFLKLLKWFTTVIMLLLTLWYLAFVTAQEPTG